MNVFPPLELKNRIALLETRVEDLDKIVTTAVIVSKTSLDRKSIDASSEDNAITRRKKDKNGYNLQLIYPVFYTFLKPLLVYT